MNVNVLSNPLKTFKVVNNIIRVALPIVDKKDPTQREFEFTVDLFPNYFDLTKGVWQVAISQAIISNAAEEGGKKNTVSTIFHISTNLLSHAVKDPYKLNSLPSSRQVVLASFIATNIKKDEFELDRFNPIYFQVENGSRSFFTVRYSEVLKTRIDLNIFVELTFLFQRII